MEELRAEEIIKTANSVANKIVTALEILQKYSNVILNIDTDWEVYLRDYWEDKPEAQVYKFVEKTSLVKVINSDFINGHEYLQARLNLLSKYSKITSQIYKRFLDAKESFLSQLESNEDKLKELFSDVLVKEKLSESK